ncbi:uncharacterized protein LOC125043029 [Penaeus chinensis]|uniref:uncharacterized protein LOC125043029 n=1 Tax=Penaeus chinensis TaxID=139456 RepID=UPI001FB82B9C|nr:uncharacterized protein LOC125043029 [Penaeus chinensis]
MRELNMDPPLFLYRLLGGLPYTWHHRAGQTAPASRDRLGDLWKSAAWGIWNYVFGGIILGYFAFAARGVKAVFSDCANTLTVISGIEDLFGVFTTFSLRVHMIGKYRRLATALAAVHAICEKYEFQAKPYWKDRKFFYIFMYISFGFICITYGHVSMALENGWKSKHPMAIFEATVKPSVLGTAMLLYARMLDVQAYAYENLIDIATERSNVVLNIQMLAWSADARGRRKASQALEPEDVEDRMDYFDGYRAKTFILELYDASMKVKKYFEFLVALTLTHAIISAIVSSFEAVSNKNLNINSGIATVGGLVMTLSPVFYITNAPHNLSVAKQNAKLSLIKYRCQQKYEHLKEEVKYIISRDT